MMQRHKSQRTCSVVLVPAAAAAAKALLLFLCSTATTFVPQAAAMSEGAAMQLAQAELVRAAGYGDERLSTVHVTGTLLCCARMQRSSSAAATAGLITFHVPGAKIGVACKIGRGEKGSRVSWAYGTTDDYGEFIVDLPSHLHAIPNLEEDCVVHILQIPKSSLCELLRPGIRSKRITLTSAREGIRTYTAGTLVLSWRTGILRECSRMLDGGGNVGTD